MDSYIDNASRLISNREVANTIDKARTSKDPRVKSYAESITDSMQFVEKALDVVPKRNAVERSLDAVGRIITPVRLLLDPRNFGLGMYTSAVQNTFNAILNNNYK